MAISKSNGPAAYSLQQLEAGLSTSSLATLSASECTTSSFTTHTITHERNIVLETAIEAAGDSAFTQEESSTMATAVGPLAALNFGLVADGVYRSSYPQAQDFGFLGSLKLKTIVTLVEKEIPQGYQAFLDVNGIQHVIFDMAGTKKADIPLPMMRSIIGLIADKKNHPMLIHCNQGKHRTGCVVGILRRYHGWDTAAALDEYEKYAHPKIRPTDVHYLRNFQLADLRHVAARGLDQQEQPLSLGNLAVLYIIAVLGLLVWALASYGVISLPLVDTPRRPKGSEI